ncbi:MAG: TonB-dependent vitamin B12 receptor [Luteimonas sp.]
MQTKHRNATKPALLPLALLLALPFHAGAQSARQNAADATDLGDVVVTGTRTAVTADQSLAAVEVIDRAQIERSQAHSLQELLRGRAGVDLANQGGRGKVSTLFLRGTESDHTLFLIDGVRVGSATSGLTALQDLPLELIERVEIVRGPRSSLYGSEAIGGVIQVFTRGGRDGTHVRAYAGAGSHGLREAGAGLDAGRTLANGMRGWFGVDATHQSDDGINACRGAATPLFAGCGMDDPDPDRDGYRNNAVSLRGGLDFNEAWKADVHAMRADAHNEYDGDPAWGLPDNSDTIQQVVGGRVRYAGKRVAVQLTAGRNTDSSDNFTGDVATDRFATHRDSAGLQADVTLAAGQLLTVGTDWARDTGGVIGGFSAFDAYRNEHAGFAQYQGAFGAHDLQLSARHDDNSQFGGHDTGSVAWGMDAAHGLRFTASYGSAFKAPSFNELYFPFYGNPDLKPETSRSAELGVAQKLAGWHWQLNAYQTTVDDLIVYDPTIFIANNIESARIRGAELGAGATLAGWDFSAQATFMDPRNHSATASDRLLPRRSRRNARLDADRNLGAWRVGATVIAQGARYDDVQNAIRMGGYATVDLRAERALSAGWTLQAGLRNAFDRFYETAAFYNRPGREWSLTLRYAPR